MGCDGRIRGGVLNVSHQKETSRKTWDPLERLYDALDVPLRDPEEEYAGKGL